MSELYLMATISDRNQSRRFLAFYKEYGISVTLLTLGRGTAASEVLDAFGLEASEKAVQFAVVTAAGWKKENETRTFVVFIQSVSEEIDNFHDKSAFCMKKFIQKTNTQERNSP